MRHFVFLLLGVLACGGSGNELDGSIGESFGLDFDHVSLRKQGDSFIAEYLKDVNGGTNKVCKVVLDTKNMPLRDDANVSGDTFLTRVTLTRVASTGGNFPAAKSGKLHFDKYSFSAGGHMEGEFDVVFDNGRTLHGAFSGSVEEVPLD